MDSTHTNQVRKEETVQYLARLDGALTAWLEHRRTADLDEAGVYMGRHKTQLEVLKSVLGDAIEALRDGLANMDLDRLEGEFYDDCRAYDQVILWLWRIWDFFKGKFDQRDEKQNIDAQGNGQDGGQDGAPQIAHLLRAADEVVWSCYRQVFTLISKLDPTLKQGPTPLTFLEPAYTPFAWVAGRPLPPMLRLERELVLEQQALNLSQGVVEAISDISDDLRNLPIPVIQLPMRCLDSPWLLVYLAHEIGHQVQQDLQLVDYFGEGLEKAAKGVKRPVDADLWKQWGVEIFADVFSVVMLGPWAIWGLAEILRRSFDNMVTSTDLYPASIVRLKLAATAAATLHIANDSMLRGIVPGDFSDDPRVENDLLVVPAAVKFALGKLKPRNVNLGTLANLCSLDAGVFQQSGGKVDVFAQQLSSQADMATNNDLATARQLIGGSMSAWSKVVSNDQLDEGSRDKARSHLAKRTVAAVRKSAQPGTRGKYAPSGSIPNQGRDIALRLLAASRASQ